MIRKTCKLFGIIYVVLLGVDILLNVLKIQFYSNPILIIFTYFLFILSIRYVFLLEIKMAVIIGIINCVISGLGSIYIRGWILVNSLPVIISIFIVNIIMILLPNIRINAEEEAIVKRKIIEFGGKIARLKVKDISEKSNIDTSTVFKILREMIKNQEIYAEYFKSSKTVAFNQIANIENIDSLMRLYEDWEHQKLKKV